LEKILQVLSVGGGQKHSTLPDIIIADVGNEASLLEMARNARLILNCVGPYRDLGEPVLKAAILGLCDYIDLCGEPEFIEGMWLKYHEKAVEAGVTIVHAAAYDSFPCDLAVLEAKRIIQSQGAVPSSVEMFFELSAPNGFGIHYATYEAAVKGFGSQNALRKLRKELARVLTKPKPVGRPLDVKKGGLPVSQDPRISGWLLPYFFSDPAVVRLTQALDKHLGNDIPPVHFGAHIVIPNLKILVLVVIFFTIFQFLAQYSWGRKVLLAYPEIFSYGMVSQNGPTAKQLTGTTFTQTYIAHGYTNTLLASNPTAKPDVQIRAQITGAEPGYIVTPLIFIACAEAILKDRATIPHGVLTPAIAFADSGLLEKLGEDGKFKWTVAQK